MGQQAEKRLDLLLLFGGFVLGLSLRLIALTAKSPWTDEFSTMAFSLGHGFTSVPLDRAISLSALMQPLQSDPATQASDVVTRLLSESNHPPLYFVLAHWWMQAFPLKDQDSLLMAARLFPALLGALSIPAMFGLGWLAFRSRLVALFCAMAIALSPYAIFLAQEARHYTLSILLAIASLACLASAVRHLYRHQPLPLSLAWVWVAINWIGIATHYFFSLTLAAQAMALVPLVWQQRFKWQLSELQGWLGVAIASGVGGLIWLPVWRNGLGSELTAWIAQDSRTGFEWLQPIFQLIAAWLTMISLLPVEADSLPVVLVSGAIMISFFLWLLPILLGALKILWRSPATQGMTQLFGGFVLSAIALFLGITYVFGIDLTRGARYNFVYFPGVILLVGACLALCWKLPKLTSQWFRLPRCRMSGKLMVILVGVMGLASSLTVVGNLGYQKYYRPDLFVPQMVAAREADAAILVATTHRTHVQVGEMMGIAWEVERQQVSEPPQFLLAHEISDPQAPQQVLQDALTQLPRPLDLWLVNFRVPVELTSQNCVADSAITASVDGYQTQLYRCR
ncbi:glycosyltransferase [Desertifilum sp. FACHB-1129]|nr:glycosyltransferase [Desertifilum sp. FACHB-1129]MBD2321894.1 glycosyltransferase [Desertifilum sp. FACHB-866]MBD2332021.1 glycosyltransferase [Desertifilum sp. FACHB-868]